MTTNPDPVEVVRLYPVYGEDWERTGFSTRPSYPGQQPVTHAFPLKCPKCGMGISGVGAGWWLDIRGWGPKEARQSKNDSVAWCKNQHMIDLVPVAQLMKG